MSCRNCAFRKKVKKYADYQPEAAVYLDYCSTTPIDIRILGVYENACRNMWANPASFHGLGQTAYETLENSRKEISVNLGLTEADNIFFTNNTYSASIALIKLILKEKEIRRIITSNIEHSSIYKSIESYDHKSIEIIQIKVNETGKMNLDDLEMYVKDHKSLILFSPVNHETGSIQEYKTIYDICEKYHSYVFFDAVQTICRIDPIQWISYCHGFIISAHKIYGPKGIALLYISPETNISFDNETCQQEGGLFQGTVDVPSVIAFSKTIYLFTQSLKNDLNHYTLLTEDFYRIMDNSEVNYVRESPMDSVPGIINISLVKEKIDMEELFLFFYKEKICLSRFSACSGKINGTSKILEAMGRPGLRSGQSLRISVGRNSQRKDFFNFLKTLQKFLNQ